MSVVRTVLAVVLAVALLAASLPAVEDARRRRSADLVGAEVESLSRDLGRFASVNDATRDVPGARLVVAIRLPGRSLSSVPVALFALDGEADAVEYRLHGGRNRRRSLPVDLRVAGDGTRLEVGEPGPHRLRFSFRLIKSRPVVVAEGSNRMAGPRTP